MSRREDFIISTVFGRLKAITCKHSADEWVVLGLTVSVFLSIYVTIAAMLFVVIYLIREERLRSVATDTPGIKYLWALCTLGFVAAFTNNNEVGALIAVALAGGFLVGAFARSVMTRALFDKVIKASCAASLFSFAVALIQYVTFEGDLDRVSSVFINANYYAAVIEMVVLFAVYMLRRAESRQQRSFYAAVIVLNAAGLYFSGCRTAVLALCAAVALMLLLHGSYKPLAVFSGSCVLLAALMLAAPEVFPRMNQLDTDMGTRVEIWRRALEDILRHPLFGEGALAYAGFGFMVNGRLVVHAHSIYLEPILSFGIAGTALILIYLKKNLAPIWQMRRNRYNRDRFVLALGLLASVALHGVVDATAFSVQTGVLLLLTLAMAGIQENSQSVLVRQPAYQAAYLQGAGQGRKAAYVAKDKSFFSKKSA